MELGTYITINKFKNDFGSAGRAPSLRVIPWHLNEENPQLG
jgi:hypothetical protein